MITTASTYLSHMARYGMRLMLMLCISVTSLSAVMAESAPHLFEVANTAYKNKEYDLAIQAYSKLISDGYKTAEVYYDLGNAYYKKDSIALAVLNYERALRLSPADEDIRHNLKLVNLKTVDRLQPTPQLSVVKQWDGFVSSRSAHSWTLLSVALVWMALIAFAVYLFVGSMRRTGFYTGVFLLCFAAFFGWIAYTQTQAEYGRDQAILTTVSAYVKSAPDASATDLFMIHEGIKLSILDHVGEWAKVRLADGKVGWIQMSVYTVI